MRGAESLSGLSNGAPVEALLAWWSLAGVDAAIAEESVNWLRPAPVARPTPVASTIAVPAMPPTLEAFEAWLAEAADLPEAKWPGRRVAPDGAANPRLMVILDMPDGKGETLLEGDAAHLLKGILRAMGLVPEQVYHASLALSRPAGGLLDDEARRALADRMAHHIALVAPRALLLLGDQTSRALLGADAPAGGGFLPAINHKGGTVPGVATFHPALMLHQPAAKAACWRTLLEMMESLDS